MYVTKFSSGRVEVKFISAHSNHNPDEGFVPLPVSTKEEIAMKLSVGISIERIMEGIFLLEHIHCLICSYIARCIFTIVP